MVDITKTYPNPVNIDALMQTVRATYQASQGDSEFRVHNIALENVSSVNAALDTIVQQHNAAILTTEQAKSVARELMLATAKNYLSVQLQLASPDLSSIYTDVRNYVNGNATLSQMITNQINVFQLAHSVTINLATPTNADRARYIECCQLVLATIA